MIFRPCICSMNNVYRIHSLSSDYWEVNLIHSRRGILAVTWTSLILKLMCIHFQKQGKPLKIGKRVLWLTCSRLKHSITRVGSVVIPARVSILIVSARSSIYVLLVTPRPFSLSFCRAKKENLNSYPEKMDLERLGSR